MDPEPAQDKSSKLPALRYLRPILYVGVFLFVGFIVFSGKGVALFKAKEAQAFACTLTLSGTAQSWTTAAWGSCNSSYPGAGNNNDTVTITTTTTTTLTLN